MNQNTQLISLPALSAKFNAVTYAINTQPTILGKVGGGQESWTVVDNNYFLPLTSGEYNGGFKYIGKSPVTFRALISLCMSVGFSRSENVPDFDIDFYINEICQQRFTSKIPSISASNFVSLDLTKIMSLILNRDDVFTIRLSTTCPQNIQPYTGVLTIMGSEGFTLN
jgi:hypothetical protein